MLRDNTVQSERDVLYSSWLYRLLLEDRAQHNRQDEAMRWNIAVFVKALRCNLREMIYSLLQFACSA